MKPLLSGMALGTIYNLFAHGFMDALANLAIALLAAWFMYAGMRCCDRILKKRKVR